MNCAGQELAAACDGLSGPAVMDTPFTDRVPPMTRINGDPFNSARRRPAAREWSGADWNEPRG
jgi:hypothetical protein